MTEWRQVEGIDAYEFSDDGRCRRTTTVHIHPAGREIKGTVYRQGYRRLVLWVDGKQRAFSLSRLVCEAFHGPPPFDGAQAAHNDGDRLNNRASNLRWATSLENARDKFRHGTNLSGEDHGGSKLTWDQVREIRRRYKFGLSRALAAEFGVTRHTIGQIVQNRAWKEPGGRVCQDRKAPVRGEMGRFRSKSPNNMNGGEA